MAFISDRVSSGRNRQRKALIEEAAKVGSRVTDILEIGDPNDAAAAALGSSLTAIFGGTLRVDGLMVLRLETQGWLHAFAQPFSGFQPLPGEHHAVLSGALASPAILRHDLRRSDYPWDPAAGPDVAQQLNGAPALRRVTDAMVWEWATGMSRITLDWAVQLRSVGDGSTHVVMQSGRYGGLTTYEVGFGQWLQLCGAVHPCLSGWAPPAQRFVGPVQYAEAVGFAAPGPVEAAPVQAQAQGHYGGDYSAGHHHHHHQAEAAQPVRLAIDYANVVRGALMVHAGKRIWIGAESIPAKNLGKLRELVLGPQLAQSPILAAVDLTLFGSTTDAIVITPTQLLCKDFDNRIQIELSSIRAVPPGQSTVANNATIVVDGVGTVQVPVGVHIEPMLALLEAIAQANAAAGAGQHGQVSAFVGEAPGQVSMDQAQALAAQAGMAMQADSVSAKINAAAQLLLGGQYQGAVDAYLAIAQAHPERTGTCYSQVGAALFFLRYYPQAIEYYEAAKHYGADPRMMDENIAEARAYL